MGFFFCSMSLFINWNGKQTGSNHVNILPGNRSFRYGDGCFETMKMVNGNLLLQQYHFERLFSSMEQLKLTFPSNLHSHALLQQISELAESNGHRGFARIRLTIYREGDNNKQISSEAGYLIETMAGDKTTKQFNEQGLQLAIYKDAQKSCDLFSSIKSNNYLPYTMAKIWANENKLDDSIVCNSFGRIADSSIANIFVVDNGIIKTPPLSEGCINGVMRRHLLAYCRAENLPFKEEPMTIEQLLNAAEIFLTNAIIGIKWVAKIDKSEYTNAVSKMLFKDCLKALFNQ